MINLKIGLRTGGKKGRDMFTKENRTNVDVVERDFVLFKNRVREVDETLVETELVSEEYTPTLLDRSLNADELGRLFKLKPWGYSFRIDGSYTAYNIDTMKEAPAGELTSEQPRGRENRPADFGLIEMDLRLSILRHIFKRYGPSSGESLLDIATNCGVIPLFVKKNSKLNVTAIDLFSGNIDKAKYLAELEGDTSSIFLVADAYEYLRNREDGSFDTISALGLFYHLSDPIGMLNLMYQKARRMIIIDTIVHNFDFSGWIQTISRHQKYEHLAHANDTRKILELHPTFRGLADALYQVGFDRVIHIAPSDALLSKFPSQIYKDKNRSFVLAFK